MEAAIKSLLRRHYALPAEHGAWVWLIGPFILGAAAGREPSVDLLWLFLAGFSAFLARQPASILIKALSGRRGRHQFRPALLWLIIYLSATLIFLIPLLSTGYQSLLWLTLPGLLVFGWHLWLVKQRAERKQPGVEVVAAGVLALMSPAAFWVAGGESDKLAAILWSTSWLQSAASIVHVHLRLEQRQFSSAGNLTQRLVRGKRSLAYHSFNLVFGVVACAWLKLPVHLAVAFGLVWFDCVHGVMVPAVGYRPARIGFRQLFFSSTFFLISAVGFWHLR